MDSRGPRNRGAIPLSERGMGVFFENGIGEGFTRTMKILVVPDKFKGTLRAEDAAERIRRGWLAGRPGDTVEMLPMSDGGDGFGEILGRLLGAEERQVRTVNAAGEPVKAVWWEARESGTAVIESARVIGLAMLPAGKWHPFQLDTFGLGAVFEEARKAGARKCVVGIGGSATNDGGFGMARGLGFRFLDKAGGVIQSWTGLEKLARIEAPEPRPGFEECVIASDVGNPLLGPEGASRVYGPQKGLKPEDFGKAEECLGRLAEVAARTFGRDAAAEPGAGAAGGLGFGLRVFLGGRFEAGFDIFARCSDLSERIKPADLVITAEGAIDAQSFMGKGTGAVAKLCRAHGKRCIGLAGTVEREPFEKAADPLFTSLHGIHPDLMALEEAKARAAEGLEELSAQAARRMAGQEGPAS